MNDLFAALLSWAVLLSGYPAPAVPPEVAFVSHQQLTEMACNGTECKVIGFHPPGSMRVYIDNRLHPEKSTFAASIVVHEFVHYLQQSGGKYALHYSCSDALAMEREAYDVQSRFLVAHGIYRVVGSAMYDATCSP
ncbi:MAG TPA: DUF6647 family protein [Burkholderiales bacterium]|jgi:hypothetical protein|nr:DUF6647 family protein [Burkholderiales bacterium]